MKKPLIVILAGGVGKSFAPLSINKTLLPIAGKPMLQHTIEMAEAAGFHDALIITNEENEKWLSQYQPFNITLQTQIVKPTGMGDALLQAEHLIHDEPILILNACDLVETAFLKELQHKIQNSYASIAGLKVKEYFPGGYIKMEGSKAVEIIEKPGKGNEPSNLINLVFHYFSSPGEFFGHLKMTPTSDEQYEIALSKLMKERHVDVVEYDGPWTKLKYPHHVLDVMKLALDFQPANHISRSAYVSPQAVIEGHVYIDDGAHIDAFAVIKGPSYIGRNVKIGNHALVRESSIEADSIVGFGSEVARSYIGPRCKLHHNFVGDSVFESDVNPSWGTTCANWRLDQKEIMLQLGETKIPSGRTKLGAVIAKGAFLGVNCSVMPGVTVGRNARIYPGKVVMNAVKNDETVK
ncbi:NTP transferase domain-containing protein [Candidatus Woesebacteria bacterium]|nr:NTP transferase domain-containing protein [Candidatus Woesebacteria bacterium]